MPGELRHAMGWLHTWTGVTMGSVMFAIFWMGTLSVFDSEIDVWMKPATRLAPAARAMPLENLRGSLDRAIAAKAAFWSLTLPEDRDAVGHIRVRVGNRLTLREFDPATNRELPAAGTLGATGFIYPFHYTLELRMMDIGEWLVALVSMAMLVMCVSGVIIHRKLFAEFFTFRPRKKPRRLILDIHNLSGVLGLPFHIVITFSGLIILGATYFPASVRAVYPNARSYSLEANDLSFMAGRPAKTPGSTSLAVVSLDETRARAAALWGGALPRTVTVTNPGRANGRIAFFRGSAAQVSIDRGVIAFDATTGALIAHSPPPGPIIQTQRFLNGLHVIRFHHWALRWLYFVLGLISCVMIATGFLFWLESRRRAQGGLFGFRLVEGLTGGSVSGIILATVAFLVANRLLPTDAHLFGQTRAALEIWAFYMVWLLACGHGWLVPRRMWADQCAAIGALAILAAVLNWVTTGDHPLRSLSHRHLWPVAGTDILLLAGGVGALCVARALARRKAVAAAPSGRVSREITP